MSCTAMNFYLVVTPHIKGDILIFNLVLYPHRGDYQWMLLHYVTS